jgi:hypothetical protein
MNHPRVTPPSRWAPWWAYLVPLVAINQLRQIAFPPSDAGVPVTVALLLATGALVVVTVTAGYRLLRE